MNNWSKIIILILLVTCFFISCGSQNTVKIATLNIRLALPEAGRNKWENRKELVYNFIKNEKIGVIGLQEVLPKQKNDLMQELNNYDIVSAGRIDGKNKGEANPVLYNRDQFEIRDSSTFWLSETPNKPGSKSWNTAYTRIVTWVKLSEKKTGRKFYFFNTHFDHHSKEARKNSALLLIKKIREIAGKNPFVLVGDFNCTNDSEPYQILIEKWKGYPGLYPVIKKSTRKNKVNYTYNGFGDIEKKTKIDHIFISSSIKSKASRIHTIKKGEVYISDHYPITSEITFTNEEVKFKEKGQQLPKK